MTPSDEKTGTKLNEIVSNRQTFQLAERDQIARRLLNVVAMRGRPPSGARVLRLIHGKS